LLLKPAKMKMQDFTWPACHLWFSFCFFLATRIRYYKGLGESALGKITRTHTHTRQQANDNRDGGTCCKLIICLKNDWSLRFNSLVLQYKTINYIVVQTNFFKIHKVRHQHKLKIPEDIFLNMGIIRYNCKRII
jgi:hypothetical protein